ncbi:hypothetical protein L1987_36727 [Smallanthus sonchifolius]|uniref:Uncharacterized protein n=1 Tax=Smallanthus sonchifolius TaxID=185202 RepID=A0ACB9HED6_9ASTR|nr:hypothetical protein L1987_36727 [Smallanthus sonchifolius]
MERRGGETKSRGGAPPEKDYEDRGKERWMFLMLGLHGCKSSRFLYTRGNVTPLRGSVKSWKKVLECNVASTMTGNLAFEEVGILVDSPLRISRGVNLEWKGRVYQVWGQETSRCWDPGFIKNPSISATSS